MHQLHNLWPRAAFALVALTLGILAFACRSGVAIAPTPVPADPFVVVRATAEAAYVSGKTHLDRGELQAALVDLDTASTNDPDARPDIQQAIGETLRQLAQQTPSPEPTSPPRSIVVATAPVPPAATGAPATTGAARPSSAGIAAATPASVAVQQAPQGSPLAVAQQATADAVALLAPQERTPIGAPQLPQAAPPVRAQQGPQAATPVPAQPAPTPEAAAAAQAALVPWRDPQGRFSLGAPTDWPQAIAPQSLFGTSVVQFRDPSAQAEFDVAVDTASRALSPELYAATMEIAMQQQVPGYAAEQSQPGSTSGNPSVRRVFTFTERDAAGDDHQARGFQVAVVKGSTPYIISGSAPSEQFDAFSATFDQVVETFRFS